MYSRLLTSSPPLFLPPNFIHSLPQPAARQLTLTRTLATTRYATSHEWVKLDGDVATVGITGFAAKALGDVVYVDLPEVGASFAKG